MAKNRNIMQRYFCIVVLMAIVGISIIVKAAVIMFGERNYWKIVSEQYVATNVVVKPMRGNILSADNQLMASSLPEYKIYMDFVAGGKEKDSLLMLHLDEICEGMHKIFPDKSVAEFKAHIKKGRREKKRNYLLYPNRISYIQYKEVKQLPVFKLSRYKGGFKELAFNQRKKPFGSLARRTLGDMYVYPNTVAGWLWGTGINVFSLSNGNNSDIGYSIQLMYGGISYLILIFGWLLAVVVSCWRIIPKKYMLIILFIAIFLLFFNYKGSVFASNCIIRVFMLLTICWRIEYLTERKRLIISKQSKRLLIKQNSI